MKISAKFLTSVEIFNLFHAATHFATQFNLMFLQPNLTNIT